MAWTGSITQSSKVGASKTWTPDTPENQDLKSDWVKVDTYAGNYSTSVFTAPKRGIYEFTCKGSGGTKIKAAVGDEYGGKEYKVGSAEGGAGGLTKGYILLDKNETVYVGAGGVCRAAFVSEVNGATLSDIPKDGLRLVAGGGAAAGGYRDANNNTGYNCQIANGGDGGGLNGENGDDVGLEANAGRGGTQDAAGEGGESKSGNDANNANGSAGTYGVGGNGSVSGSPKNGKYSARGGRGGDGYYGGGGGASIAADGGVIATGGGAGSGYIRTTSFVHAGREYISTTTQGGGAEMNEPGSVKVTYYAIAELPVVFDGVRLTEIFFNGIRLSGLIKDGTRIFARWIRGRRRAAMV